MLYSAALSFVSVTSQNINQSRPLKIRCKRCKYSTDKISKLCLCEVVLATMTDPFHVLFVCMHLFQVYYWNVLSFRCNLYLHSPYSRTDSKCCTFAFSVLIQGTGFVFYFSLFLFFQRNVCLPEGMQKTRRCGAMLPCKEEVFVNHNTWAPINHPLEVWLVLLYCSSACQPSCLYN